MFGRKKIVFRCEACSARLIKRTSFLAHKFLRHDSYVCENPMCGATYTGHSELTGIASPSGVPTSHSELPPTRPMSVLRPCRHTAIRSAIARWI